MTTVTTSFPLGVVEGFYGRPWSHESRLEYADYLVHLGMNSYLYCPKADPYLRKRWQEDWPEVSYRQMSELAETYTSRGLAWGVGLSPFALYENYDAEARQALKRKVEYLSSLHMPTLAILFDDMPGSMASLAARQAEIISDVFSWSSANRILVCPTYYSFDPVLGKYFGEMPSRYWQDLGENLPASVDIFWTGNKVCSDQITTQDIDAINKTLGRKVTLWDNYPVNDGAVRSNFLYTSELSGRDEGLAERVCGHYCNPMNQAHLSLMALRGLAALHGASYSDDLARLYGEETWRQLKLDREEFENQGISGLGSDRCRELAEIYRRLPGPAAREVAGWLQGEYTFDPDCLTD
jgi:hypothetical protein